MLCRRLGAPDSNSVEEVREPAPSTGEVLIDVHYAGVNYPDLLVMRGEYQVRPELPFVPGAEGSGVVRAIGEDVTGVDVGDRVMFVSVVGAFAESIVVPEWQVTALPDHLSFELGAVVGMTYGTSYYALKQRARLAEGETLLVLGAAGGVGSAAVALGKSMGATVIAGASSETKRAFATRLGADSVVDYTGDDFRAQLKELTGGRGVDVVYDPVGGAYSELAFRSLGWDGRHLVVGFTAGDIARLPLNLPLLKSASLVGVFWGAWAARSPEESQSNYAEIFSMIESGVLTVPPATTWPLDGFVDALDEVEGRRVLGKVALQIS